MPRSPVSSSGSPSAFWSVVGHVIAAGGGRSVFQALEGEEADVAAVFLRINADPRHSHVRMLAERTVTVREFGTWAMAPNEQEEAFTTRVEELLNGITCALVRGRFQNFSDYVAPACRRRAG